MSYNKSSGYGLDGFLDVTSDTNRGRPVVRMSGTKFTSGRYDIIKQARSARDERRDLREKFAALNKILVSQF